MKPEHEYSEWRGGGAKTARNHRPLDTKESDFLPYLVIIFIILALPY